MVLAVEDELEYESGSQDENFVEEESPVSGHSIPANRRVQVKQSPYLSTFYKHHQLKVIIDSGAETSMIRESVAISIGAKITKSSQLAFQADGQSPLEITGETRLTLTRGKHEFTLDALVVKSMDVDVLAGVPFMEVNAIGVFPAK